MPISLRISTVVALLVLAGAASMASANEVLFSCTTTNGKPVQLSQSGDTLHYRFGAANKPELVFSNRTADKITCAAQPPHLIKTLNVVR